jgi:Asp-tRNA(Asn)/Glu-tRNA(Gln) amidotransferase A subunit family amidase
MKKLPDLATFGAAALARQIRAGDITSRAAVSACLDRIAEREAEVQAWQYLDRDYALRQADTRDATAPAGLLHGVPIGIKDILDTADMPTGLGSPLLSDRRPSDDSVAVQRLRAAGAVIVGKTVSTEFAYFTPGKTRNPHDPSRTPGGSSSGSAAAVADNMVPVAIATQAAGSTIRPASFCGIWAYKPTFDRWALRGSLQLYPTLDTLSIYGRKVEDLALIDRVLAEKGQTPLPKIERPRIGVFTPPASHSAQVDNTWRRAVDVAARHFGAAGAEIVPAPVPEGYEAVLAACETVLAYEAVNGMSFVSEADQARISPIMRNLLAAGRRITDAQYDAALRLGEQTREAADAVLGQFDAVLAPGATGEAPVGLDSTGNPVFIRTWNFLHTASANVPLCAGPNGMPIGVQMLCARGADERLLSVLGWIEPTVGTPLPL